MDSFDTILRSVWGVALAIFFFGGTIFIHELGHFLAAKKRGLKVERFSIGFGPRVWGWTGKDGVDYRISLFPLGGYVALPQMADMSAVEGETLDDAEKLPKIGYADKMIVAVMGAAFNVLFAIVLACILWVFGRPEPVGDNSPVVGYVVDQEPSSPALLKTIEEYTIKLNQYLGYDFNTVEFAVRDGIPYAIDFCNPAPDADRNSVGAENFEWVVETMATYAIERAKAQNPGQDNLTWGKYVKTAAAGLPLVAKTATKAVKKTTGKDNPKPKDTAKKNGQNTTETTTVKKAASKPKKTLAK